jgi:hypothetical protein
LIAERGIAAGLDWLIVPYNGGPVAGAGSRGDNIIISYLIFYDIIILKIKIIVNKMV